MTRRLLVLLLVFIAAAVPLLARVGGGESYSGGGGSSGGGGGGGDGSGGAEIIFHLIRFLFWLTVNYPAIGIPVDIVVLILVLRWFGSSGKPDKRLLSITRESTEAHAMTSASMADLRKFDPNFSEVTFVDFCYSLYARAYNARGEGTLANYAPYLSERARRTLLATGGGRVAGIVIGSFAVRDFRGLDTPVVEAVVEFEANYTEVKGDAQQRWYKRERWTLERQRDILSPTPEHSKAEHCPKCGAALQTRTDGSCAYCGTRVSSGSFNWFVKQIDILERSERRPNLLGHAPERGTDLPTRHDPRFQQQWVSFGSRHREFDWKAFEARVRLVATELQAAWSSRDWERARPYETDALFQMHRYWIDEYKRQKLRNVVDDFEVRGVEAVKVTSDAFFDAMTVRIYAQGRDYTVNESGQVVSGSNSQLRVWTEYWTFIRGRATTRPTTTTRACPNCGAALKVGETGICAYCNGKVTSGDFDWVLSRIEQDESYTG